MKQTPAYQNDQRNQDFHFFVDNYEDLFRKYGKSYIAIRDKHILGSYPTVTAATSELSEKYPPGTYILQECTGETSAYMTKLMGVTLDE